MQAHFPSYPRKTKRQLDRSALALLISVLGLANTVEAGGPPGTKRWESDRTGEMALAPSGTLYVNGGGVLAALDGESGAVKWTQTPEAGATFPGESPVIDSEGFVYILQYPSPSYELKAVAFDGRSGIKVWSRSPGLYMTPRGRSAAIGFDDLLLFRVQENLLYLVYGRLYGGGRNGTGWVFGIGGGVMSGSNGGVDPPSVGGNGVVYFGGFGGAPPPGSGPFFFALDGHNGQKLWQITVGGGSTRPAIGQDGTVYFGAGKTLAVNGTNGVQRWEFSEAASEPVIGPGQAVYVFSGTNLFALDGQSGALIRQWAFQQDILFPPVFGRDGTIYLILGGKLCAIEPSTGQKLWEFSETVSTPPILGADSTIYTSGAKLYAVWGSSLGGPGETGWPMMDANPRRTCRASSGPPSFPAQPYYRRVEVGQNTVLGVECDGSIGRTYQWHSEGPTPSGATNSYLELPSAEPSQSGWYSVTASNSHGEASAAIALVRVVSPGAPEIRADGETLVQGVTRLDQSTVSISTAFTNGWLFYTTDGSPPTFASELYQGAFVITNTTTIRAIAYSEDLNQSAEEGPFQIQILPTYSLTTSVMGQGTVTVSPSLQGYVLQRYASGTSVTLTATPVAGWRFLGWAGDAGGTSTNATVVMDTNKTVIAVFEVITLTATTPGGGTISGNTGNPYPQGTVVNLTAQPASGWQFLGWQGDASGTNPDLALTMNRTKTVQAVFGTSVGTTVVGQGGLSAGPIPRPLPPYGWRLRVTALPSAGYYFVAWGNAASGNINPLYLAVTNPNPVVSSLFVALGSNQVALAVFPIGGGNVAVNPQANVYGTGTSVTLTATRDAGQSFLGWGGDAAGAENPMTVLLDQSKTISASFTARSSLSAWSALDGMREDGFRLTVSGELGAMWRVEGTTDFSGWQPVGSVTNTLGTAQITDPSATNLQHRFYRALAQ
jgi:hypothetical protein